MISEKQRRTMERHAALAHIKRSEARELLAALYGCFAEGMRQFLASATRSASFLSSAVWHSPLGPSAPRA
jgi:hypothetical protein